MNARRILFAAALFPAVLALLSCGNNGNADFKKLNARAAKEYLVPVRPGVPGGQPFWNVYSNKFTYAPAFDFPEVEGAARYRFDLWLIDTLWTEYNLPAPEKRPSPAEKLEGYKALGSPEASFTATSPKADLSPVWTDLPVAQTGLVVTAVDASGKDIAPVGTWEFLRDFPFNGPYPEACRSYRDAALMAMFFNHRQPLVKKIHDWQEGTPFETGNIFCSKFIGSVVESEALMAEYIPSFREECLENARKAAEILISLAPKEGKLAHIPPTYYNSDLARMFADGNFIANAGDGNKVGGTEWEELMGQTMTFDPIYALKGYLALYDASGDKKYFDEAIAMMRSYDALIDENGFVPKKLYISTGEGVNQEGALSGDLLLMIQRLQRKYGVHDFDDLERRCAGWMKENALKEFNMSAQYEDVSVDQRPYQNLTNMTAGYYSRYLMQKDVITPEELQAATDMLHFVEDQFIHWEHLRDSNGMFFCLTPGVYEQYACKITIDASNDCFSDAALSYYEKTGDRLMLEKARAIMNTVVNSQACNGEIATFMGLTYHDGGGSFWINCSVHSIETLLRMAEFE